MIIWKLLLSSINSQKIRKFCVWEVMIAIVFNVTLNALYQCIRCNKQIRIKIFVLWFHGRCHIEQIDVRLLSKTQNRNDVSTWNLVQMLCRHRYTTLFSWNFKFLFEIWITVKSNMIGRFTVTMATNSKHWRHDYVCYVTKYLCPKCDIDTLFNF